MRTRRVAVPSSERARTAPFTRITAGASVGPAPSSTRKATVTLLSVTPKISGSRSCNDMWRSVSPPRVRAQRGVHPLQDLAEHGARGREVEPREGASGRPEPGAVRQGDARVLKEE